MIILFASSIIIFSHSQPAYSESNYEVSTINFSGRPASAIVNENENEIYVTDFFAGKLLIINGTDDKIIGNINVTRTSFGVGYNPVTDLIYVGGEFANVVNVVNPGSKSIENNISMPDPYDIAIDSQRNITYITSDKTNKVFAINGTTNKIISNFDVNKPCGIAVNSQTGMIYVTSETDDTLHIFDTNAKELSELM